MRSLKSNALFLLVSLFIVVGCSEKEVGINHDVEAQFSYSVDAVFEQKIESREAEPLKGVMTIHSHETNTDQVLDWYVVLDEDLKTLSSSMKSVLPYGVYDFQLVIEKGEKRYVAESKSVTLDGESSVPLAITPVIGDHSASINLTELPKLKFSFPLDELQTIGTPKLGVSIDGGAETIMSLSKITVGTMPIDIDAGVHTIVLSFYDGAILVGKSVAAQESVTIVSGYDIVMDIVPLSAKTSISSTIDGGELTFSVAIPHEIVDEVGGLENLTSFLRVMSAKNSFYSDPLTVTPDGDDYVGTITFPEFYYDDNVDLSLQFMKKSGGVVADGSLFGVSITSELKALTFPVKLLRESISSGNLLARGIVNVYNADNTPAAGAMVYLGEGALGLVGADGSLEFFATAGNYTLRAEKSGAQASEVVDLTPLGSHNYTLTLSDVTPEIPQLIWQSKGVEDREVMFWNGSETIALTDNDEDEQWFTVEGKEAAWFVGSKVYLWDGISTKEASVEHTVLYKPNVSLGYVVWAADVNGSSEIFMWNGYTVEQITNDGNNNRYPHNYGARATWVATIDGKDVIRYWDRYSIQTVSTTHNSIYPRIGNSIITWYGTNAADDILTNTYIWERDGNEIQLTNDTYQEVPSPHEYKYAISGNSFIWTASENSTGNNKVNFYNGTSLEVVDDQHSYSYDVSGSTAIWAGSSLNYWDGTKKQVITTEVNVVGNIDLKDKMATWIGKTDAGEYEVFIWNGEEIIQVTNTVGVLEIDPFLLQ